MSTMSTFGAYTTARLGIYSSTKWLDVIGNNISNINTEGYTRQSVDQISLYMRGSDKYQTGYDHRVGNGGLVQRVTQMRDPYIDIRYRNEISSVGAMDARLGGLQQVSSILDEVAYGEDEDANLGVMELQFNDLISQMQRLVDEGAGEETFDTNVRTSAASLCSLFNSYADRLEELRQNQETGLVQDIQAVNDILSGIRDLSDAIRKANLYGGDALEQKDQRNLLIDQLAEYIRIDVKYTMEEIAPGQSIEKLVINLNGNDQSDNSTNKITLVDGVYCAQLSIDHPVQMSEQVKGEDGLLKFNGDGSPVMRLYYYNTDGTMVSSVTEQPEGAAEPTTTWYDENGDEMAAPRASLRKVYVDDEGNETANTSQAKREFNDFYLVEVSPLRDQWNRTMDVPLAVERRPLAAADELRASVKNPEIIDRLPGEYANEAEAQAALNALRNQTPDPYPDNGGLYVYTVAQEVNKYGDPTKKWSVVRQESNPNTVKTGLQTKWDNGYKDNLDKKGDPIYPEEIIIDGKRYEFTYNVEPVYETVPLYEPVLDENGDPKLDDENNPIFKRSSNTANVITGYEVVRTIRFLPTTLTDNTLYGAIQAERELLTEQGEYATKTQIEMDRNANVKRGIPYYQKALDTLANFFAATMNEANVVKGGHLYDENGLTKAEEAGKSIYPGDYFKGAEGYVTLKTTPQNDGTVTLDADGTKLGSAVLDKYQTTWELDKLQALLTDEANLGTWNTGNYFELADATSARYVDPNDENSLEAALNRLKSDLDTAKQTLDDNTDPALDTELRAEVDKLKGILDKVDEDIQTQKTEKMDELVKLNEDGSLTAEQLEFFRPKEAGGKDAGVYEQVDIPKGYKEPNDGPLFSNHGSGDSTGVPYDPNNPATAKDPPITAANISVSKSWGEGSVRIQQSKDPLHPSTDNSNLYHILNLLQVEHHEYTPLASDLANSEAYYYQSDRPQTKAVTFRGSFQRMFTDNISGKLATDVRSTNTMLNNYATAADELYVDRDAVMGVDLNDETMNMMQVQKSLTAAYRLMTVIDDMLDRLINNTAI